MEESPCCSTREDPRNPNERLSSPQGAAGSSTARFPPGILCQAGDWTPTLGKYWVLLCLLVQGWNPPWENPRLPVPAPRLPRRSFLDAHFIL